MVNCSEQKEKFLGACQAEDCQEFLEFLEKHKSKSDDFSISDVLVSTSKKQHDQLWKGLFDICARTLAKLNSAADPVEEGTLESVLKCLQGIVTVGTCTLDCEKPVTPDKMLETLTILHGVLLDLPESASKLQFNIAKLCQTWWTAGLSERELLVPNTIMYLLVKSLQPTGTRADVRLLYTMRESLSQISLADESSTALNDLLEQCFISPTFLKFDEGRKFLSHLFCLDVELVERLHAAIKNQLPSSPKNMVDYYGEVYFKAWRNSINPITQKIETYCIQDLMHCAIHARRVGARNLSYTLRQLLSYFTKQKRQQGVDKMLLKLYEPILWRAFKVANAAVRANAAALLIDAFPLQDPEANKEDTDALLQRQIDILQGFLDDPCPVVRVTGVQGVCRILGMFWELIPAHVLTTFLTKLIRDMAFDVSSSDVRVAVFKGLIFVVDNHLSHPLLKNLLPTLKDFIHDTSEKVVLAFVDLLLKVKGIRTIKVWNIVPVEDLLARLEMDSPPVARRLVSLLFSSFQPTDRDASVQIERCMTLICMNPGAARVFYQYAHKHMAVATTADFMLLLGRCVRGCINQAQHQASMLEESGEGGDDHDTTPEDVEKENEEGLSLKDTNIIDGMLETVAILWTAIAQQLAKPVNQSVKQKLVARFSKDLPKFLATFQEGRSLSAVLLLAGFLPSSTITPFSHSCMSKLKSLSPSATPEGFGPLLQCLVSWGRGNDIITLISDWLEGALKKTPTTEDADEEEEADDKNASKKKRKVAFVDPVTPQPGLGLAYLDWLLSSYLCRTVLLDSCARALRELAASLKVILVFLEKRLLSPGPLNDLVTDEILVGILQAYCRLNIHLQALTNDEPSSPTEDRQGGVSDVYDEMLAWADRELLPVLTRPSGEGDGQKSDEVIGKLATDCLMVLIKMSCDMIMLGFGNDEFQSHLANFCHLVLKTDAVLEFSPVVAKVMCQLGRGNTTFDERHQDLVSDLFTQFIKALGSKASKETEDSSQLQKTLSAVKPAISDVLRRCDPSTQLTDVPHDGAFASAMAASVGELTGALIKSDGALDPAETPGDLPPVSGFLLGVIGGSQSMLTSFVHELERCVSVGAMQSHPALLAALHLLYPLSQDKKKKASGCGIKECLTTIQQQMEKLETTRAAPEEKMEGDDEEEEKLNPNDPHRFMFQQMHILEEQISQAIGGVA